MWRDLPDHPDIAETMRSGYPHCPQEDLLECEYCGRSLWDDEVFEDQDYEHLCWECLRTLHKKEVVWEDS